MTALQQILAMLNTAMSVILLLVQIKASEGFMSKVIVGFKEWAQKYNLSISWIARAVDRSPSSVSGWFNGGGIRDPADVIRDLQKNLNTAGYTAALEELKTLLDAEAAKPEERETVSSTVVDETIRLKVKLYSKLEGLEERIRVPAVIRAEGFQKTPASVADVFAVHKYNDDKFDQSMLDYQEMVNLLSGDQRYLLEPSTQNLTAPFIRFVELWERYRATKVMEVQIRESTADALYDDVRVHAAKFRALEQVSSASTLSLAEIQALLKGADVQLKGPFLRDKIAAAESPFENSPFHSAQPTELARAHAYALKHTLESSFKHYSHFDLTKRQQALQLIHPLFHQALSGRLRGQYSNHITHHNYTYQMWRQLVAAEVEHELVGF